MGASSSHHQGEELGDDALERAVGALENEEKAARGALDRYLLEAFPHLSACSAEVSRLAREEDKRTDMVLAQGLAMTSRRATEDAAVLRAELEELKRRLIDRPTSRKRRRSRSLCSRRSSSQDSSRDSSRSPPRSPSPRPPVTPALASDTRQVVVTTSSPPRYKTASQVSPTWRQPARSKGKGLRSRFSSKGGGKSGGKGGGCFKCGNPNHCTRDCPARRGPMEDLVFIDELLWGFESLSVQKGGVPSSQSPEVEGEVFQWGNHLLVTVQFVGVPLRLYQPAVKPFRFYLWTHEG